MIIMNFILFFIEVVVILTLCGIFTRIISEIIINLLKKTNIL